MFKEVSLKIFLAPGRRFLRRLSWCGVVATTLLLLKLEFMEGAEKYNPQRVIGSLYMTSRGYPDDGIDHFERLVAKARFINHEVDQILVSMTDFIGPGWPVLE